MFIPILLNNAAQLHARGASIPPCSGGSPAGGGFTTPGQATECVACIVGTGKMLWTNSTAELSGLPHATVRFLGSEWSAFTFTVNVLSISVGLQAIAFITCGAIGDYSNYRHRLFVLASVTGATATMLFILIADPSWYALAAWLCIISNVCYGLSFVLYNSYLVILVDDHPEVKAAPPGARRKAVHSEILNYMSTIGFVVGYVASIIIIILAIGVQLVLPATNQLSTRGVIFLGGLWWALWSIWTFRYLGVRPAAGTMS
jgi:UMF1 family MFS transporter